MNLPSKGSLMNAVNLGNSKKGERRGSMVEKVIRTWKFGKEPQRPLNPFMKK